MRRRRHNYFATDKPEVIRDAIRNALMAIDLSDRKQIDVSCVEGKGRGMFLEVFYDLKGGQYHCRLVNSSLRFHSGDLNSGVEHEEKTTEDSLRYLQIIRLESITRSRYVMKVLKHLTYASEWVDDAKPDFPEELDRVEWARESALKATKEGIRKISEHAEGLKGTRKDIREMIRWLKEYKRAGDDPKS